MNFAHFLLAGILLVTLTCRTYSAHAHISAERESDGAYHVGDGKHRHAADSKDHSHFDHEAILGKVFLCNCQHLIHSLL